MAPPKPKNPTPRPRGASPVDPTKKTELDLPFDDGIQPLRADDPSPQHVPQLPSSSRKAAKVMQVDDERVDDERTSALPLPKAGRYHTPIEAADEALPPTPDAIEVGEPGFSAASLYVERGAGVGQLAPIRQGTMLIGRASNAGLRLQHPSISRRHAQVTRRGERFFIKDLGSQNGTYVNQIRIEREVEIFPGDELVLGTSQIRLRGPSAAGTNSTRSRPDLDPGRQGPSVLAIAIASCAVGIGLATVIIFAIFKLARGPSYEQAAPAPPPLAAAPASPDRLPPPPAVPAVPASVNAASSHVDEPAPPPEAAAPAAAAPAPAPAPKEEHAAPAPKHPAHPAKVAAASPAPEPADPAVMARYETGNVAAAIELARKKSLGSTAARLASFQASYDAGQKALLAQDELGAFKHLEAALKLDEQINGGWGKYNGELRSQLSALHTLAGTRQAKAGDAAAARKSFSAALKLDPDNGTAKAELQKLGGKAEAPKQGSRASAIDAAFGN